MENAALNNGTSGTSISLVWIFGTAVLLLLLVYEAVCDGKTKKIRVGAVILAASAGICLRIADSLTAQAFSYSAAELLFSFFPGILLLALALAGRGVGTGDALLFLAAGILWGDSTTQLLLVTFLLAGAAGLILHFAKHRGWKDTMPLAPFMLAACVILTAVQAFSGVSAA